MGKILMVVAVSCLVVGCQGPTEGPPSGQVAFGGEDAPITHCDWRTRVNGAGESALVVYVESGAGLVTMTRPDAGEASVLWAREGHFAEECPATFAESTGAWTITADCPSGEVVASISGCMMAD